ncbi:hypothetical protein [Heliorestis convoluta]|uniref:hypothetical protein n=1 Tax=Heliorestis convoluta TaxID=356322 RepID=UPI00129A6D7C|nr:hypothetical protein [Heliorestis convoluta]
MSRITLYLHSTPTLTNEEQFPTHRGWTALFIFVEDGGFNDEKQQQQSPTRHHPQHRHPRRPPTTP